MAEKRTPQRLTRGGLITLPPAINVDQGRSRNWSSMADSAYRMSVRVDDRLDEQAAVEAMRAGTSGDLTHGLMFQPTVRGRAYTQQATKSYWQNLEATARVRIDELAAANRADPQGMQGAVDKYIQTTTSTLPVEFKGQAQAYLTATSRSHIASARAALVKQRVSAAEASGLLAERTARLEIDRLSAGLFSPDTEAAAAAAEGLEAVRARLAALYSSTVTDDLGNRVPVFSPESRAKAAVVLEERVAKGSLTGWYEEQSNKLSALAAIANGQVRAPIVEDGKVVGEYNPMASLSKDEQDKVITKLRGAFSAELGIQSKLQLMHDRAVKKRDEAVFVDFLQRASSDPTLLVRGEAALMLDNVSDPALARQLHKMVVSGSPTGELTDSTMYNIARIEALQGNFDYRAEYPGLPVQARAQLLQIQLQAAERAESDRMFDDGDFRDARDLISTRFANADYQAIQARVAMGEKSPKLDSALKWTGDLMQAKAEAAAAGQPFDSMAWYRANVAEVVQARGSVIAELRAELEAVRAEQSAKRNELAAKGLDMADRSRDPEMNALRQRKNDIVRRLQEASQ